MISEGISDRAHPCPTNSDSEIESTLHDAILKISAGLARAYQHFEKVQTINLKPNFAWKLIEGQWLKIPGMCKDRSISVDPRVVTGELMGAELAAIHASLDGEPVLA